MSIFQVLQCPEIFSKCITIYFSSTAMSRTIFQDQDQFLAFLGAMNAKSEF